MSILYSSKSFWSHLFLAKFLLYLSAIASEIFNLEDNKTFFDPFEVQPVGEKPIDFPEVQYALDKAELLVNEELNSEDSLDFLYNTLIDNPNIVIELQAHTDCRGGDDYNQKFGAEQIF